MVLPALAWYVGGTSGGRSGRPVAVFRAAMLVSIIDVVLLIANGRLV